MLVIFKVRAKGIDLWELTPIIDIVDIESNAGHVPQDVAQYLANLSGREVRFNQVNSSVGHYVQPEVEPNE